MIFAGTAQNLAGSVAATFNNVTVSPGSTTTVLTAGQKLSGILLVDGHLNSDGNLTLLSTPSGTALINGAGTGQVSGNVTMERYLNSGFGYKYFSSPFQAATVGEFGDDINLAASSTSFYRYDEARTASGWVNYKTTTNVPGPMAGYAVNMGTVNAPNTVDVTAVVNNERVTNQSQPFLKGDLTRSLIRLTASFSDNLDNPDCSVIYLDDKATAGFDGQLDALKLMNTDLAVPNLYVETPGSTKTSIKSLPYFTDTTSIVPLGLKTNMQGELIFRVRDIEGEFAGIRISLTDKVAGTEQDLLDNQEYKITLTEGEYNDRFFLNLCNTITDIPDDTSKAIIDGIPENNPSSDFFGIYYSNGILKANIYNLEGGKGTLFVCNLLGQALLINKFFGEGYHEFSQYLKDGIYITVVITGNRKITKKLLIVN